MGKQKLNLFVMGENVVVQNYKRILDRINGL